MTQNFLCVWRNGWVSYCNCAHTEVFVVVVNVVDIFTDHGALVYAKLWGGGVPILAVKPKALNSCHYLF